MVGGASDAAATTGTARDALPFRMRSLILALLLFAVPLAGAQDDADPDQGEPPEETVEESPGVSYGIFVLLGTVAVAGVLLYVATRRGSRGRGGGWK